MRNSAADTVSLSDLDRLLLEGQKEVLGSWVAHSEGAKFWLQVLTELQNRGVKYIFIAGVVLPEGT
jgi:Transposase, Mutator family